MRVVYISFLSIYLSTCCWAELHVYTTASLWNIPISRSWKSLFLLMKAKALCLFYEPFYPNPTALDHASSSLSIAVRGRKGVRLMELMIIWMTIFAMTMMKFVDADVDDESIFPHSMIDMIFLHPKWWKEKRKIMKIYTEKLGKVFIFSKRTPHLNICLVY